MGSNATQIHHRSCSKCDHLIKVQMHKVFLNNLWIWLYLGIIKAKLEAEGQSRAQGRDFLHILIQSVSQSVAGQELSVARQCTRWNDFIKHWRVKGGVGPS